MIVYDVEQRTEEWFGLRLGRLTGSAASDMLATLKSKGEAAARRDLRLRLVLERLVGQSQEDGYVNADMQRGVDLEPVARAAYEALTGAIVNDVGFCAHDDLLAGCSPDGEIGGYDGLIEIKCPRSATHLGYLRANAVPSDYLPQITHNLWITGAQWCDFVSHDPRFPAPLDLFVRRVARADVDLSAYELAVRLFLSECERELAAVQELMGAAA